MSYELALSIFTALATITVILCIVGLIIYLCVSACLAVQEDLSTEPSTLDVFEFIKQVNNNRGD